MSKPVHHTLTGQLANQPTSQPASQPTNQPANQPANQPTSQPANQPANQLTQVTQPTQPASPASHPATHPPPTQPPQPTGGGSVSLDEKSKKSGSSDGIPADFKIVVFLCVFVTFMFNDKTRTLFAETCKERDFAAEGEVFKPFGGHYVS